jgi:putative transcriptional regulator
VKSEKNNWRPPGLSYLFRFSRWPICQLAMFVLAIISAAVLAAAGPQEPSSKSFFLVASRDMADPIFQQSVILMLPPDEPPLVSGVIINKPTDMTVGKLMKPPLAEENRNEKVYFGGPVDITSPLLVMRTPHPPKQAMQLGRDIFALSEVSSISDSLRDARYGNDARLYLGRAQWVQQQLRGELLEGAWNVMPVRADLIFDPDSAKIWPILSQHEHVREISTSCSDARGVLSFSRCSGAFSWKY